MPNCLHEGLSVHFSGDQLKKLRAAKIGIAGAGGLGSNVAMLLARCGMENFTIIDDDVVDASNLNRQHYWPDQLGQQKIRAIAAHLLKLNPDVRLNLHDLRLTAQNLPPILASCPIWVEALDNVATKRLLVEKAQELDRFTVAASGLAGFGGEPLGKRRLGNLVVVGDFHTAVSPQNPPLAPRVMQAASLMADTVLEYILGG